jgi:hypothetical protein
MGPRFRGWPEQAYAVLLQLSGEPARETRERVRHDREARVRQPMIDLLSDLADAGRPTAKRLTRTGACRCGLWES